MDDKRNPYVILGIPYGASRDAATRAFARKAKGKRRTRVSDSGGTGELTNLTWALNQISDYIRDPRTALDVYRIPADPGALEATGTGILNPPPELLARTTVSAGAEWARLLDAARDEAVAILLHEIASTATLPSR